MIDHDRLAAFSAFAEHLSFTHAAEELHVSQPALHVKIQKLSAELGVPLYLRRGRRLELTEEGRRVAAFARDLAARTADFVDELHGAPAKHPVVLAAGAGAYLYLLGPALRSFIKTSKAPLRLLTLEGPAAIERVLAGEAQLGVAATDAPPPDLESTPLARVGKVLVVPRGHGLATKRKVALADLEGEALVVPPLGRPHRTVIARALADRGVRWDVAVEASGWELMLHFVRLGLGAAIVNDCCTIPRGLVARPLGELSPTDYLLLHRPGRLRGAADALKAALLRDRRGL